MKAIRTEVYIESTVEWVWRILTDFEVYPKWNPLIRAVERTELAVGARPSITIHWPGDKKRSIRSTYVRVIPAAELCWRGNGWRSPLFDREHAFEIEPYRNGVRVIQTVQFSGWLAPVLAASAAKNTRRGMEIMNQSLKKVAEAKH